jgi:hypothetical protein
MTPLGAPFWLGPDGTTFAKPVMLTVPVSTEDYVDEDGLSFQTYIPNTDEWQALEGLVYDSQAGEVRVEIDKFSVIALFRRGGSKLTDDVASDHNILDYVNYSWDIVATIDDLLDEDPNTGIPFKDEIAAVLTATVMGEDIADGEYIRAARRGVEWLAWEAIKDAGFGWLKPYALVAESLNRWLAWIVDEFDEAAFNNQVCNYIYFRSSGSSPEEIRKEFRTDQGWVITTYGTGCMTGYPRLTGRFTPDLVFEVGEQFWSVVSSKELRQADEELIRARLEETVSSSTPTGEADSGDQSGGEDTESYPEEERPELAKEGNTEMDDASSVATSDNDVEAAIQGIEVRVEEGQSIQDAIDFAMPGTRIVIQPGTYVENLTLNKSIELVAATSERGDVVIRGGIKVTSPREQDPSLYEITVQGLSIEPGETPAYAGVSISSHNVRLVECIIHGFLFYGVFISYGNNVTLSHCTISHNQGVGVLARYGTLDISHCEIWGNGMAGVRRECRCAESWDNVITGSANEFADNGVDIEGCVPVTLMRRSSGGGSASDEVRIPEDYGDLQSAVDAVHPGGTVRVSGTVESSGLTVWKPVSVIGVAAARIEFPDNVSCAISIPSGIDGVSFRDLELVFTGTDNPELSGVANAAIMACGQQLSLENVVVRMDSEYRPAILVTWGGTADISGSEISGGSGLEVCCEGSSAYVFNSQFEECSIGVYVTLQGQCSLNACRIRGGRTGAIAFSLGRLTMADTSISQCSYTGVTAYCGGWASLDRTRIDGCGSHGICFRGGKHYLQHLEEVEAPNGYLEVNECEITNNARFGVFLGISYDWNAGIRNGTDVLRAEICGSGNKIPGPSEPDGNALGSICPDFGFTIWPDTFLQDERKPIISACAIPPPLSRLTKSSVKEYLSSHPVSSLVWKRLDLSDWPRHRDAFDEEIKAAFSYLRDSGVVLDFSYSRGPFGKSLGITGTSLSASCAIRDPDLEEIGRDYNGPAMIEGQIKSQNLFVALFTRGDIQVDRIIIDDIVAEVEFSWISGYPTDLWLLLSPFLPGSSTGGDRQPLLNLPDGRQSGVAYFVKTTSGWELEGAW